MNAWTRARRWWPETLACIFLAAWIGATYFIASATYYSDGVNHQCALLRGALEISWYPDCGCSESSEEDFELRIGEVRLYAGGAWSQEANLAWRPYHRATKPLPEESDGHAFVFPLWLPALTMLCASAFRAGRRRGARAFGCCQSCGYDLRRSAPGAVCPECGSLDATGLPAAPRTA